MTRARLFSLYLYKYALIDRFSRLDLFIYLFLSPVARACACDIEL